MHLQLIHEDDHLLVLDKPAGLLAVPGRGADKKDCLSTRALERWSDALIVHRLDMATSGLMLMARGLQMQRVLSEAFAARQIHKRYAAVVDGLLTPALTQDGWGVIDLPIIVDWPHRPLRIIDMERGKPSTTRWHVVSHDARANTTRLELEPVTGRSHQLRVHLKAIGHTILGDALYGASATQAAEAADAAKGEQGEQGVSPRLLLHACALGLTHPATGAPLHFESPVPF
jgi:tRNA pseudouridine32 synthase/23S rRNA pseudouridine746 synthase